MMMHTNVRGKQSRASQPQDVNCEVPDARKSNRYIVFNRSAVV
jgi:hypothetical protein